MKSRSVTPAPDAASEALQLEQFLPYRLSVAAEAVSSLFASRYQQRFGLSIPEWRVVAVLGQQGEATTQAVIERTAMDRVRVSRAAIRLEDKGLVERRAVPGDQRARVLRLSRRGRAVYAEIVPLARALQAALATALSAAEQQALGRLLDKIGARTRELAGAAPD
ncbi:MarR family winged helix-turn-helix transcriptional regulator [Pseudoroseomonas cervicalis]|uniref:MarR family winged helix-turn-helix transcriptional regulator n=1 Tax=Teichococcus cervicalis TaxID=204525 RepID=UPI00278A560F|nr:MarR family winged helix-turn-helix transcriptional regulator [Pseudoroseomonas cervicalis]MDQ1078080.1 DNA-binding MarR family transcriptional regulator [Pseudoroseomonas cervicalis]